jgi:hypothetical protein
LNRRRFLITSAAVVTSVTLRDTMLQAQPTPDGRADAKYLGSKIKHISDDELFASLDFSPRDYQAWAKHWAEVAPKRELFRDIDDFLVSRDDAAKSYANGNATVLAQADEVLKHNIKGWGPVAIQHGPIVDFNADYGQSGKYGFHYWGWARPLVHAFLLTRDQKYLDEFESLFNSWYEQRDKVVGGLPNLDVVYYELGLGVRNRLFFEYYFLPHENRSAQTHERLLKTFLGAARWLHEEQKLGYRPHNWQMIGAFGLAHIAAMMPEFREWTQWLDLAAQRMFEHSQKDFFADGCFSERCPSSYNIIAYRDPRNLGVLLSRDDSKRALVDKLTPQLEAQVNFLTHVVAPDGFIPGINDGARAKLLKPIADRRAANAEPSAHFAPSGFTVMRSDFTKDARYLLINHGPYGGGHSHADTLSFELHGHGQALAIDSGLGDTYDDPLWSSWYVHAKAHNMLTVDLENPDRAAATGTDVAWTSNERFDHFAATHHGYEKSKGIVHRRQVLFVKPNYFVIYDVIDGSAAKEPHSVEWNLHPTVALDKKTGPGLIVAPSEEWARHSEQAWASVVGIPGFDDKNQTQIEWLRFTNRINPGEKRNLAVLLFPFTGPRPDVTLKTVSPNEFMVGRDIIRFTEQTATLS